MIGISWNCRGLGNPRAVRALCDLVKARKPDFVFLMETLVHANKIEEIRIRLGFDSHFCVNKAGRGGGLAFIWRNSSVCKLMGFSSHHIDMIVSENSGNVWRCTGFYGYPDHRQRRESWALLQSLSGISPLPWCIFGDFNDMLSEKDKRGGVAQPTWLLQGFREAVMDCRLCDLRLEGHGFTWERSRGSSNFVEERLDKALVNLAWQSLFPHARLFNLVAGVSDHSPIEVKTAIPPSTRRIFKFRFENSWLVEPELQQVVESSWETYRDMLIVDKIRTCTDNLAVWSRGFFKKFKHNINICKQNISRLRASCDRRDAIELKKQRVNLSVQFEQKETYWRQRAKSHWLKGGDANTKYFHAQASSRRKINRISKLIDDRGEWVDDILGLKSIVESYFTNLFTMDDGRRQLNVSYITHKVSMEDNHKLIAPFSMEEFQHAIFQMQQDKAPGPDGLNPAFFQLVLDG